jgi:hypothetical protein
MAYKYENKDLTMHFLMLAKSHNTSPPAPDRRQKVLQRIQEDIASGVLVARGALGKRATGAARISCEDGAISIEDPPEGDGWMAAGGFSIIEASSKQAAIADAEKTLSIMGDAVIDLIEVTLFYPRPPPRS